MAIDDEEFNMWVGGKLDVALGPHPTKTPQVAMANQPPMQDYLQMSRLLASTVGQGMMQFSQAVATQATTGGTASLGQATPLESSKGFDRDQIEKLKDACGVMSAKDIPNIWYVIQTMRGKAYDTYRDHLKKLIKAWCKSWHIKRDKFIYLKAQFFDDLVALHFNPGGPVAQYKLAMRGISMLACRSLTAVKAEYQRGYEETTEQTKTTRKLEDLLKDKGKTVAPVPDYMQLKLHVGTFCALLWALFGEQCNYYKELVKIHCILDREECFTIRDAYTKEICTQITWAIIDDGRSFFGRNPVASDFAPGTMYQFSVSCLDSITDTVRNALPVQRATFPKQWTTPVVQEVPMAGLQMQRGQNQMPTIPPLWATHNSRGNRGPQGKHRRRMSVTQKSDS